MTVFHTPNTYSDEKICREFTPFIGQVVGSEKLRRIPPMTGTEDFGYVTAEVPGMFIFFGAGKPGSAPLHSPQMVLDEDVLPAGAAIYANVAAGWLAEQSRKENKKDE